MASFVFQVLKWTEHFSISRYDEEYKSPEWPCKARRGDPVSTASLTSPSDPTNAGTFLTVLITDVRFEVPSQDRFIFCSSWLPPHRAVGCDVEERGSRLLRNAGTFLVTTTPCRWVWCWRERQQVTPKLRHLFGSHHNVQLDVMLKREAVGYSETQVPSFPDYTVK